MEFEIYKGGKDAFLRGDEGGTINVTVNNSLTAELHYGVFEGIKTEKDARELADLICYFVKEKNATHGNKS